MTNQSGYTVVELLVCVALVATVVLAGVIMYTAAHFIGKFW